VCYGGVVLRGVGVGGVFEYGWHERYCGGGCYIVEWGGVGVVIWRDV